jgi:hypothetical protein
MSNVEKMIRLTIVLLCLGALAKVAVEPIAEAHAKPRYTAAQQEARATICHVFRTDCADALEVARCESGYSIHAQNGQYLGLFQMGSSERRIYGHGTNAWRQARAAYRYFVASGRDWSPWSCKP